MQQFIYTLYNVSLPNIYDHLKNLSNSKKFLKQGITFEQLDKTAYSKSDNEFAKIMREEEQKLFKKIREKNHEDGSNRKT